MEWAVRELAPPTEEPITLEEAKIHLREDGTEQDGWITRTITAAREFCETFQGRAYIPRTFRLGLERFPAGRSIYLPRPPLQSVAGITYTLADGTEKTLDPALYLVETTSEPGAIHLRPGASWPGATLAPGLPVQVEFTAGYSSSSAVPRRVVQAQLLLIGHWFENREAEAVGIIPRQLSFAVEALLWQERAFYPGPDGGGA